MTPPRSGCGAAPRRQRRCSRVYQSAAAPENAVDTPNCFVIIPPNTGRAGRPQTTLASLADGSSFGGAAKMAWLANRPWTDEGQHQRLVRIDSALDEDDDLDDEDDDEDDDDIEDDDDDFDDIDLDDDEDDDTDLDDDEDEDDDEET